MANLSAIVVGSPNRIETEFNLKSGTSLADSIFDDKDSVRSVLSTTANGPILSYAKNTTIPQKSIENIFSEQSNLLYKKISAKSESGPSILDFGSAEPYISVNPNSSNRRDKLHDTRLIPFGSVKQDTVRITKFTTSGKGLLFNATQFLLQGQNSFNETRIYNPLSVIQSTVRPTSLGLIPRSTRHVSIGSGLLSTFLGSIGLKDNSGTPPTGTAAGDDKLDVLPDLNQSEGKGLIRAGTGASARQKILNKYGGTSTGQKGSFLGNLAQKLVPMLASQPNQFNGMTDEKIYRADQDLYNLFIEYYNKQSQEKPSLYNGYLQKYTGNTTINIDSRLPGVEPSLGNPYVSQFTSSIDNTPLMNAYFAAESRYPSFQKSPNNPDSVLYSATSNGKIEEIRSKSDLNLQIANTFVNSGITYQNTNPMAVKYSELSTVKRFEDHIRNVENYGTLDGVGGYAGGKGFSYSKNPDRINVADILDQEPYSTSDQIAFWFHDIVNKKYLQFRATVNGINDNSSVEWNELNYVGMPDKIYNYKGFTRTLGFSFVVYLNSVKELHPTWKKLNYLMSFRSPSKYVDGKYSVPPILELRMGDLYHNVPIIINSISFSIPEDVSWETWPAGFGDYYYMGGLIKIPDVRFGQFPNRVEINIGAYVLENENYPRIGNTSFGPNQEYGGNFHLRSFEGSDNIVDGVLVS